MLFVTLNVCGLRDVNKRLSLMQWLSHLCSDIVCLQETHVTSRAEAVSWFSPFGFLVVVAPGSPHSCGSVILYRPRLFFCRSWTEQNSRFLMAEFSDRGTFYRIACIYAPNRNPERDSFFASITSHVDLTVPTFLCGDFNAVLIGPATAGALVLVLLTVTALPPFPPCFITVVWLTPGGTCTRDVPLSRGCARMGLMPPGSIFLAAPLPGSQASTLVISLHVPIQITLLS